MKKRLALALLVAVVVACGKRGDPRPPVPVIPQATSDLVVTQRGAKLILSWSYPALTTAGRSLTGVRRIVVHRYVEELPVPQAGRDPNTMLPGDIDTTIPRPVALFSKIPQIASAQFARLSTRLESIESANLPAATTGAKLTFEDTPPFRSIDGRPVRVNYAVVTEGDEARGDFSNLAIIVPLDVPVAPVGLTATAAAEGVTLSWSRPSTAATGGDAPVLLGYNVYRSPVGQAPDLFSTPINNTPVTAPTYTDAPPYGEHEYRVSAVASVGTPRIESDPSAPVRATFKDLVPPPAPATVTPLVETKVVRLIWDAVEAADLAGYKVYRSEGVGHEPNVREIGTIPMNGTPLTNTTFDDPGVDLGIAYRYAVTAVDRTGNESPRTWTRWVVAPKTP